MVYSHDPRDPAKQGVASSLIGSLADGVLLWQVVCEFLASSRKLEPFGYDREQAWRDLRDLRRAWATAYPDWAILDRAENLMDRRSISFWDALILAACLESGVTCLYSEDLDSHDGLDGLEIFNPFRSP